MVGVLQSSGRQPPELRLQPQVAVRLDQEGLGGARHRHVRGAAADEVQTHPLHRLQSI